MKNTDFLISFYNFFTSSNTLYTSTINKKNRISLEFDASGIGFGADILDTKSFPEAGRVDVNERDIDSDSEFEYDLMEEEDGNAFDFIATD